MKQPKTSRDLCEAQLKMRTQLVSVVIKILSGVAAKVGEGSPNYFYFKKERQMDS